MNDSTLHLSHLLLSQGLTVLSTSSKNIQPPILFLPPLDFMGASNVVQWVELWHAQRCKSSNGDCRLKLAYPHPPNPPSLHKQLDATIDDNNTVTQS